MAIDVIARGMAAAAQAETSDGSGSGCECGEDHLLDSDVVTDSETDEALDEVFGVDDDQIATTAEVNEALDEVFGSKK